MTDLLIDGPRRGAASGKADALVVFLHGYGANGDDLFGLAEPLGQVLPNVAFASPNAPQACRIAPAGCYQWFPIPWIDGSSEAEMMAGFTEARASLSHFLEAELARADVDASRLVLFGFSQGAMMALQCGPTRLPGPAAIVASSGRLALPEQLASERRSDPSVLLLHGDQDDVVPYTDMEQARIGLEAAGVTSVQTHTSHNVGHSIAQDGLITAAQFLINLL